MEGTTGTDGDQEADHKLLMSSKPLHRFVQKEPKCLGIVILIFGCAELLMGFQLASESVHTSCQIYIPFWQGALEQFNILGNMLNRFLAESQMRRSIPKVIVQRIPAPLSDTTSN